MPFRYIVEVNGEPDEQAEKDLSSYAGQKAMARSRRYDGMSCLQLHYTLNPA